MGVPPGRKVVVVRSGRERAERKDASKQGRPQSRLRKIAPPKEKVTRCGILGNSLRLGTELKSSGRVVAMESGSVVGRSRGRWSRRNCLHERDTRSRKAHWGELGGDSWAGKGFCPAAGSMALVPFWGWAFLPQAPHSRFTPATAIPLSAAATAGQHRTLRHLDPARVASTPTESPSSTWKAQPAFSSIVW